MTVRQLLPEGLAKMAPGPRLGAALAGLDRRALAGSDLVEVLQARSRQVAHEQAQLLAVMAEIGWCDPHAGPDEVARLERLPDENEPLVSASDEIRAALAWTSPLGRVYHTRPQPITTDLPDPLPRPLMAEQEYPDDPPPDTHNEDGSIFYRPPPASDPTPPSASASAGDPDEPPPF
ncbi:MAG: hypothetical protein ACRDQX_03875 [Pseudonocardiaceae bacterium]